MDDVGFPAGFFFHFGLWKMLDFYKELQYHPYPTLDFASVEGMDGLGFPEKIAVSSNIHTKSMDFLRFIQLYLWKMLDFRLDFL